MEKKLKKKDLLKMLPFITLISFILQYSLFYLILKILLSTIKVATNKHTSKSIKSPR